MSLTTDLINYLNIFKLLLIPVYGIILVLIYQNNDKNIDSKLKGLKKYLGEQYSKLKTILIFSILISFLIYFYLPASSNGSNIENLFKIASSGISILGAFIVAFSVATINSTSHNYSTRLLDLFMDKSFFKAYLFLIILSLGVSSIIGAFIPPTNLLSSFLVVLSLTLLVSNFIALFIYIDEIIRFMKPEHIGKIVLDEIKFEDIGQYLLKYRLGLHGTDENHFSKYPLQYLDIVFRKTIDGDDKHVLKYLFEETNKKYEDFEGILYNEYLKTSDLENYVKLHAYFIDFYYEILKNPKIKTNDEYTEYLINNLQLLIKKISNRKISWDCEKENFLSVFFNEISFKLYSFEKYVSDEYQKFRLLYVFRELVNILTVAINSSKFGNNLILPFMGLNLIGHMVTTAKFGKYFSDALKLITYCEYVLVKNNTNQLDDISNIVDYLGMLKSIEGNYVGNTTSMFILPLAVNYFLIDFLFSEKEDFSHNLKYLIELYELDNTWVIYQMNRIKKNKFASLVIGPDITITKLNNDQHKKFLKLYDEFQKKTRNIALNKDKEVEILSINFD
ncbi:hypothetical protein MmarC5_1125 [Methanococcus maripaludis C5]|uniref:Uncharacterized protein n=1 Tax=Methanococcus maripaludis (strain C5 / ATCC BAA-1333) TaxID=402880 RepID=A4FYZ2_METM5|nr:hypothetical protein [Methanococcus maripaludis]ABO35426.1 hypothetical protein MmarC5_1125 [Methanococcus maripaludis C5]